MQGDNHSSEQGNNGQGDGVGVTMLSQPVNRGVEEGEDRITEQVRQLLRAPTPEEVAALKAQFPKASLHLLTTDAGFNVVVFTPVPPHAYARFRRHSVGGDDKKAQAVELLFRDVIAFPAAPNINQALALKPALGETFGQKVIKLAGLEDEENVQGKAL